MPKRLREKQCKEQENTPEKIYKTRVKRLKGKKKNRNMQKRQ